MDYRYDVTFAPHHPQNIVCQNRAIHSSSSVLSNNLKRRLSPLSVDE
ncbi:Hypothetical protein ABZS17I87_01163 [Kosakonia cowanii]